MAGFDWNSIVAQVDERQQQAAPMPGGGAPSSAFGAGPATDPAPGVPAPPPASPAPAAAPSPPANPWGAALDQVEELHQSEARAANYAAHATTPDTAARALTLQQQTGIPASVAEQNMPEAERRVGLIQSNAVLAQDPELARWLAANPQAARVARDDYEHLSTLGKTVRNLAVGWTGGQLAYERGNLGNNLQLGLDTPEQRQRLEAINQQMAQDQVTNPGGVQGFVRSAAGFASSTLDNALVALSTGAAAGGAGAAGGAVVGSAAGGVGAVPGAVAGGVGGFTYGAGTGFLADMARNAAGNIYADLSAARDANGQSVDEWAKQGAALVGGVGTFVLGGVGAGAASRGLSSLFTSAVREAAVRPTVGRALGRFASETAKAGLTGAVVNGGMEMSNLFAEQAAKALSSGDFPTVFNSEVERHQAVEQLVHSMVDGAALLGAFHALPGGVSLFHDNMRARQAAADVAGFQALEQGVASSQTRGRAPSVFMDWLQRQTEGTPAEHLFIPGEAVRSLYQDMQAAPGTGDGLLGFVPDLARQLDQARATGGDIVVPTADFLTHLAGTDVSKRLLPDMRVRQDAMSANEAKAFQDAYAAAMAEQDRAAEVEHTLEQARRSPLQTIYDDVLTQSRQAGHGTDVANQHAALYAARYEARADRLGVNPLSLYQSENLNIVRDLPQSLQAVPADGLDALIAGVRAGRKPPSDRDLQGPSLMEFLARRGGVEDRGGDLKAMGADAWHQDKPGMPRFIRPYEERGAALPGMAGDQAASRHGPDAATLAAHEAGYLPGAERPTIDALHEAISRELAGHPVRSEKNAGNQRMRDYHAAMADLAETLDRLGIDPKRASNAEIKAALARGGLTGAGAEGSIRVFEQQAGQPVSRITGEEIAPSSTTLPDLRAAARGFYARELQGTSVRSTALGQDVEFRSARKAFNTSAQPDKLRLFAALRDIIAHGTLDNSALPRDPVAETNTKAYHYLTATVEIDGRPVKVGAMVREDNNGHLYYNHAVEGGGAAPDARPAGTRRKGEPRSGDGGDTYDQKVGAPGDGINLDLQQPDGARDGQARGRIDFTDAGTTIRLFARSNLSTFLHETGHGWLDELTRDAVHPDAPEQLRGDMAAVLKWLGVDKPEAIGTEQHEQFARGVEAYLMEGKAPSAALEGAFARFKTWLVGIYRSVAGLRVEMSPEIRQVMDRLVATDEQIEQAQAGARLQRLFKTAADAVMTDAEFAAYERTAEAAKGQAERTLLDKAMADVRRQRTAWWKNEAAQFRTEVERQVDARPEMQAMELLRRGKPRGSDAEAVPMRLNRADLEAMFGPGVTDVLPRAVPPLWSEKGGVHPDQVAEMVGLRSGDELVRKLMGVGEQQRQLREAGEKRGVRAHTIEQEVQARMVERHGDVLADGSIEEEAQNAVHNEMQLRAMGVELQALGRRFREAPRGRDEMQVVRDWARRTIGDKQVADATAVNLYARAEAKAAQAAFDALDKADPRPEEAYRQQCARMLNHALFIEAKRAADDVDRASRTMTRYAGADTLPGMDQGALDQIHALLERLDFGKASGREVERRQSLAAWVEGQRAQGLEPAVPARLLDDAFRQHYSTMTVDEVRGLSDAVQSIAHLGRLKQTLLDRKEARDFDALVQEAVDTAGRLPQREVSTRRNPGVGGTGLDRLRAKLGSAGSVLRMADASLLKMEQVLEWLDGKDSNGVFQRVVFRRLSEAQVREHDMQKEIAGKLRELNAKLPKQGRRELDRLREVAELPDGRTGKPSSMTKGELLAVALNTGNEGNLGKMLQGEGWTAEGVRAALDRHLTKADWDFVQGTWDTIESLWPQVAALEKRVSGVEPEKVQRTPVETAHGTYDGGYYPLVYDPLRSMDVEQNRQRSGADLFENNYTRATTSQGHTMERVDGYARPLLLSLDVLPRHLNAVIHDLAYREAVMDADRFLAAPQVREAVEGTLGREYYAQFRPWLQSIANDQAIDPRGLAFWDRLAHKARTNGTMVGLGFRLSTMVVHGTSAALNSVGEAGLVPMSKAVGAFMRDPKGMRDFVFEKSGEMRNRLNEVDRDMRDALRDLHGDHGPLATVRRYSMMGVAMLDMASALPTWAAAHTEALKRGMDDADAIYAADQSVRNAHGAGGAKDHSAIQRGSETQKLFTMFYSFWNHLYNRQRDLVRDARNIGSVGDFGSVLARSFFYLVAPPIIHGLIAGGSNKDDGEEHGWAGWAAEHIGLGLVSGVPVVRDVASALGHGSEYRMSPAADAIIKAGHLGKDVARALGFIEGEPSDRWVRHAIETPGYFLGLPTGQAASAGQFLWDVWHGDEDPQGVAEWMHGIMYGPAPKGGGH